MNLISKKEKHALSFNVQKGSSSNSGRLHNAVFYFPDSNNTDWNKLCRGNKVDIYLLDPSKRESRDLNYWTFIVSYNQKNLPTYLTDNDKFVCIKKVNVSAAGNTNVHSNKNRLTVSSGLSLSIKGLDIMETYIPSHTKAIRVYNNDSNIEPLDGTFDNGFVCTINNLSNNDIEFETFKSHLNKLFNSCGDRKIIKSTLKKMESVSFNNRNEYTKSPKLNFNYSNEKSCKEVCIDHSKDIVSDEDAALVKSICLMEKENVKNDLDKAMAESNIIDIKSAPKKKTSSLNVFSYHCKKEHESISCDQETLKSLSLLLFKAMLNDFSKNNSNIKSKLIEGDKNPFEKNIYYYDAIMQTEFFENKKLQRFDTAYISTHIADVNGDTISVKKHIIDNSKVITNNSNDKFYFINFCLKSNMVYVFNLNDINYIKLNNNEYQLNLIQCDYSINIPLDLSYVFNSMDSYAISRIRGIL